MSHGADNLDHASDIENTHREWAIAAVRKPVAVPKDFNEVDCVDCDGQIPEVRLSLGKFTCVACQTARERVSKLYSK